MNGPTFAPSHSPHAAAVPRMPAPRAARPEPDAGNGLRVLTYLRLHWLMIVFCGTLIGAAGAYAAWELLPSKFESYALLQVSSAPTTLANYGNPNQNRTDFTTYVKTTANLIKSDFVLNAALRDIKDLQTIKSQKEPIKFLTEELQVTAADGSEVVRITMAGHDPGDTKKIVDAVQKAFMAEVVQKEVLLKKAQLQTVEEMKQEFQKKLEARMRKPDAIIKVGATNADGAPNPFPIPPANGLAPPAPILPANATDIFLKHDPKSIMGRYARAMEECERLPRDIQDGREHLKELEGKIQALKKAPLNAETLTLAEKDSEVVDEGKRRKAAKTRYEFARAAAGNSDSPPDVQNLKFAWESHEARYKKLLHEKAVALETAKRKEELGKLADEWEKVKHMVKRSETHLASAKAAFDQSGKQLAEMPALAQVGFDLPGSFYDVDKTDLNITDLIFGRLVSQFHLTRLELESPARVRLLQPASNPSQRDMRKQILGTVFAGLMGYGLLAFGVIGYETMGRRISSLADVRNAGPSAVVGVIPGLPNEAIGRDPVKRIAANEALDKLRTYVTQTWLSRGATTVVVTSPIGDEGKAFTAFGLASSLAQAGYRTLAIDFDLLEPALHAHAGVDNGAGMCEILRGEMEPRAAVQALANGLDLVTAGKWSDDARKAAVGGRLEALLSRMKESYDCVVMHGHALLTAAESVEVARRSDVVLLCAEYRETKSPLLRRATDRVAAMEIPYSGVVYVGATEEEALC